MKIQVSDQAETDLCWVLLKLIFLVLKPTRKSIAKDIRNKHSLCGLLWKAPLIDLDQGQKRKTQPASDVNWRKRQSIYRSTLTAI